MPHMQLPRNIWRRDHNGIGLLSGIRFRLKITVFVPEPVEPVLELFRVIGFIQLLCHKMTVLSQNVAVRRNRRQTIVTFYYPTFRRGKSRGNQKKQHLFSVSLFPVWQLRKTDSKNP